jgi:beta-xylosidase
MPLPIAAEARTYTNPIFRGDFPDPFVLPVEDHFYAYATNAHGVNVQTIRLSSDFTCVEYLEDALPSLPDWAAWNRSLTWAPAVSKRGEKYVLYYTTRFQQAGLQCISRAISNHPAGPFNDESIGPFICQDDCGGSIDPSPFVDDDGQAYLLWKNDGNSCQRTTGIWIQKLSEDGMSVTGKAVELIQCDQQWELPLVEGPSMLKYDGRYYLFYSANWWESADYAVGYAISDTIMGNYTKPLEKPLFVKRGKVMGPGGQEFFTDPNGTLWMAYHGWTSPYVGYPHGARSLRIEPVHFVNGIPLIDGPTDGAQSRARPALDAANP